MNRIPPSQTLIRIFLGVISVAIIIVGEFMPERRGDIYGEAAIGYFICVFRLFNNPYGGNFLGLILIPVAWVFVIFMMGSLLLTLLAVGYISVRRSPTPFAVKTIGFVFYGLALSMMVGLSLTILSHNLGWGGPDPICVRPYYFLWPLFFTLLGFSYHWLLRPDLRQE